MRRTLAILALSGLVAAVVGSASDLTVRGETIQAGSGITVACDTDGIDANWGLETGTNTVNTVRFSDVDKTCEGVDLWVQVTTSAGPWFADAAKATVGIMPIDGGSVSVSLAKGTTPTYPTPESIQSVRVWLEG